MKKGFYLGDTEIYISANAKTGYSINIDTCKPTPWCWDHCYRRKRTKEDCKHIRARLEKMLKASLHRMEWAPTPNAGPITWPRQVEAYKRNEAALDRAMSEGMLGVAAHLLRTKLRSWSDPLRACGTGDLQHSLCMLLTLYSEQGGPSFLFSRRPEMIDLLRSMCEAIDVQPPYVIGSADPSTKVSDAERLVEATRRINGTPVMAYATALGGLFGRERIDSLPYREHIKVVFGYHASQHKTLLNHELECPATAGNNVTCTSCRRCFGPYG